MPKRYSDLILFGVILFPGMLVKCITLPGEPRAARFHQRVLYPGDRESACAAAACGHVGAVTSHLQGASAAAADSGGEAGLRWRALSHAFDGI